MKRGLHRLQEMLPSDVTKWDLIWISQQREHDLNAIGMANMARLLKKRTLHARALYRCSRLSTAVLLNGCLGADGTKEELCREDLVACLDARESLRSLHVTLKSCDIFDDSIFESSCTKCDLSPLRKQLLEAAADWKHDFLGDRFWATDFLEDCGYLCATCTEAISQRHRFGCQNALNGLPNTFQVTGFGEFASACRKCR